MADRLQESVEIIRRDRDRSRDFLADVSHELRTPLAALRMFNELLKEGAADDPEARGRVPRIERPADRAARLAGPEPARAVQARFRAGAPRPATGRPAGRGRDPRSSRAARRPPAVASGCRSTCRTPRSASATTPSGSARSSANLVGNAVKFTPRDGSVAVDVAATPDGARIEVDRHRRRDRGGRAAAHLRALLSRLAGQRGARQRQRPRTRHRALDRGHARRDGRGREPRRARVAVHRHPAARPATGRGHAGRRAGRGRLGGRWPDRGCGPGARSVTRWPAANVQETSPSERPQVNPGAAP